MKILALDVAVTGCAVAFRDGESGEKWLLSEETERGQAERLIPVIEEVMAKAGRPLTGLNRIAVTRGPGSFTGVRIGLSTARTLGMSLSIPVLGFSTLETILEEYKDEPKLLAVLDTKRGDYYGQPLKGDARIYTADEVENWAGTLKKDCRPDLLLMAELTERIAEENFVLYPPSPLYLREAEVTLPS